MAAMWGPDPDDGCLSLKEHSGAAKSVPFPRILKLQLNSIRIH